MTDPTPPIDVSPCRTCGACCAYSAEWPRFTVESDDEIDAIPPAHISEDLSGMRCEDDRCTALDGAIGLFVTCTIHAVRPVVCRDCEPGDEACEMARAAYGFDPINEDADGEAMEEADDAENGDDEDPSARDDEPEDHIT